MTTRHALLGGKVQVFKRPNSPHWQCSASVGGRQFRSTTKQESLALAKDFAEDWFLTLQGKHRFGGGIAPKRSGKTFREGGEQFVREYEALTLGERNPEYVKGHSDRLRVHLYPFFGDKLLSEITPGLVQEYRVHRMTSRLDPKTGEPKRPARTTLHHEIVTLRQVLKTANRHGWLAILPDLSTPYKTSGKIVHRAWFSPAEYKLLYEATRERAANPRHNRGRWAFESQRLHDYVLFMVNTGLRPDEAGRLEFRDVEIVLDEDSG
ncbi:MAG: site-specific integrase, partial [Brevundimonas sp.]|nr:site-specific integrase [Brevundimonas sp.]